MSERTHWEGCYLDAAHHRCAIARIEQAEREIADLATAKIYLDCVEDGKVPMAEAEDLRSAMEEYGGLEELLDRVDARDSLAFLIWKDNRIEKLQLALGTAVGFLARWDLAHAVAGVGPPALAQTSKNFVAHHSKEKK